MVVKMEVSKQVRQHGNQTKGRVGAGRESASPEVKQIPAHTWRGLQTEERERGRAVLEGMKTGDFPEFMKYVDLPRGPCPEFLKTYIARHIIRYFQNIGAPGLLSRFSV